MFLTRRWIASCAAGFVTSMASERLPRFIAWKPFDSPGTNWAFRRQGSPSSGSDLDHLGAEVGEQLAGQGRGVDLAELQDSDAVQRT